MDSIDLKKENDNTEEEVSLTQSCYEWLHTLIISVTLVVLVLTFFFRLVDVDGRSMMDTLHDKDRVVVTNFCYTPDNGDIVVISQGQNLYKPIIKRVIATEGQTLNINFNTGEVSVNGVVLDEPYIKDPTKKQGDAEIPSVIPKGMVFVMGDNRDHSTDSRFSEVGLIPVYNIIGQARIIISPLDRIRIL
ncbi:MAG: signal peptidase I [Clostridia bacterium]|jgi:signal peptidase I|nr:signal peptidase I [Clostridia bacterium]